MATKNYKWEEVTNEALLETSRTLMKLLSDLHPHYTAIVTANSCELCEWVLMTRTDEYIRD